MCTHSHIQGKIFHLRIPKPRGHLVLGSIRGWCPIPRGESLTAKRTDSVLQQGSFYALAGMNCGHSDQLGVDMQLWQAKESGARGTK